MELDVPVLLHLALPVTTPQVKGYEMISTLGNMFDDTIALTRLILSGMLDWLDIVSPLPLAMRLAYDMMGANRLLYSSDHPWVDPKLILDRLRSLKLPAKEETKILQDNARTLFNL